jgi:PPIC-type PPIASE domain
MSARLPLVRGFAAALALALAACSGEPASDSITGDQPLGTGVVASVDGVPIAISEVEQLARDEAFSADDALARLQAEALLAAEAARRGYAAVAEVEQVASQARVQALLRTAVERVTASPEQVEQAYRESGERFASPEKRASRHALASLPKTPTPEQEAAAREFARAALSQLAHAPDLEPVWSELSAVTSPLFAVSVETLPAVALHGPLVSEFSRALFERSTPGVLREPVRTQYGWHAIVVTEIVPALKVDPASARAELQRELDRDQRERALHTLLRDLQDATGVSYDPAVQKALAVLQP